MRNKLMNLAFDNRVLFDELRISSCSAHFYNGELLGFLETGIVSPNLYWDHHTIHLF